MSVDTIFFWRCPTRWWMAPSPSAPLAEILKDDLQRSLDFEVENRNEEGSWSRGWSVRCHDCAETCDASLMWGLRRRVV
jgi:hypothetical protein